jgi:hypothetical protein
MTARETTVRGLPFHLVEITIAKDNDQQQEEKK